MIQLHQDDPLTVYKNIDTFDELLRINVAYLRGEMPYTYYTSNRVDSHIGYSQSIAKLIQLHKHGLYITSYSHAQQTPSVVSKNYVSGYCPRHIFEAMFFYFTSNSLGIEIYGTDFQYVYDNFTSPITTLVVANNQIVKEWNVTERNGSVLTSTGYSMVDDILSDNIQFCIVTPHLNLLHPDFVEQQLLRFFSFTSVGNAFIID